MSEPVAEEGAGLSTLEVNNYDHIVKLHVKVISGKCSDTVGTS